MGTSRTPVTVRITTQETFAQVNAYILLFVLAPSIDVSGISWDEFVNPNGRVDANLFIIRTNFPENYMELKTFGNRKGEGDASKKLRSKCATTQF